MEAAYCRFTFNWEVNVKGKADYWIVRWDGMWYQLLDSRLKLGQEKQVFMECDGKTVIFACCTVHILSFKRRLNLPTRI